MTGNVQPESSFQTPAEPQSFVDSKCPDRDTLIQMISGTVPIEQSTSNHLECCSRCQQLLDQLSESGLLSEYRPWVCKRSQALPALEPPLRQSDLGSLGDLAIESVLGRGGMGIVFRGRDLRLQRDVAVKFIHPGSSLESEKRFTREARALAALQHESIVPIYRISRNSQGQDYIVLPLIQGLSLRERLRTGEISPRQTAEFLSQIAGALSTAHASGLVHRDVKPDNILLDETDQRAKITDFGLVRIAQEGSLTQANLLCGTPEYMSPEQAAADDRIDQRSDIYSLGVTMYECLTGTPPFRGRPMDVIDQHRLASPIPPRRLNRLIPEDLETICLKAICKEPDGRYQTMEAMRDDLQRFLDGKPILAKPTSSVQIFRLWCRRNPRLALALSSAIGSLILGTIVSSFFWLHSASTARRAQNLAGELAVNQGQLQVALATSESQRTQAEKRFRELRKLANDLVFEIYPQVEYLENSLAAREAIIASALQYLDQLYHESSNDLDLQAELATAYEKIGELLGVTSNSNLGDKKSGLERYLRARELRQAIYDADPKNPQSIQRLAHNHYIVGRTLWANDQIQEAEQAFQMATELQRQQMARQPDDEQALNKLAVILIDYAAIPSWDGQYVRANEFYQEAQSILDGLIQRRPDQPEYQKTQTRLLRAISKIQSGLGNVAASEASLFKSIEIGERLVTALPNDFSVERSVWLSRYMLGELYISNQVIDKVVPACQAAIEFPEGFLKREPTNAFVGGDLANSYFNLARGYRLNKDFRAAILQAQNALQVMQRLADAHPEDREYQRNLAVYLCEIARGYTELAEYQAAVEPISQAIAVLLPLAESDSGSIFNRYDLSLSRRIAARAYHHLGQSDKAQAEIEEAIKLVSQLREAGLPQATDELLAELQDERETYSQPID